MNTIASVDWGDMGPYALVAQATRLLGQVLRHISETPHLDQTEAMLLENTLRALSKVIHVEGQLQDVRMLNQQAVCSM